MTLATHRRRAMALAGLIALCAAVSVGVVACNDRATGQVDLPECAPPSGAVSAELLAFLSKARSVHTMADLAEDEDRTSDALEGLDQLVDGPLPGGEPSPEVREVLADTLARSAELRSTLGQFEEAKADVARGLKLATERTHYRGRLLEVLGVIESRLSKKLETDGDVAGAEAAKGRALEALTEAIDIQEEVINKTLAEDPPDL